MKKVAIVAIGIGILAGILYVVSLGEKNETVPTSADNAPPGSIHNLPVPEAVAAVRTYVAQKTGVAEGLVVIETAFEREWPDGCLGLGGPDKFCTQAIVPGWEVTVTLRGKSSAYRTNADGSLIVQE